MSDKGAILISDSFETYRVDGSVCPTIVISRYDATDAKCRVLVAKQVIPSLHSAVRDTVAQVHRAARYTAWHVACCQFTGLELR
jgi:hypothetical protein